MFLAQTGNHKFRQEQQSKHASTIQTHMQHKSSVLSAGGWGLADPGRSQSLHSPTPDVGRKVLQGLGDAGPRLFVCNRGEGGLEFIVCRHVFLCAVRRGESGVMIALDEFITKDMAPSALSPLLSLCIVPNRPHEA